MKEAHPLHWLEKLVYELYNPFCDRAETLAADISAESEKVLSGIRNIYFSTAGKAQADDLMRRYYSSINQMAAQLSQYQMEIGETEPQATLVYSALEKCLNKISEKMVSDYGSEALGSAPPQLEPGSVLVNLNTDQIALLLRAATETGMLHTLSMSAVFRSIIPHLSTREKKSLSWNTTRTKAYEAEDRNIQIAINTLEVMIRKLKGYQNPE